VTLLISKEAENLIIAEEVSSAAVYKAKYQHPEWPGGASGITIGIGYDVGAGVKNKQQLWNDWRGHIPDAMITALEPAIGVTGEAAHALLGRVRNSVNVPWEAAIAVFEGVDIPRWYNLCKNHLPNFEMLSPDCKGALVSLAYNRGASFDSAGDRYTEMRAIKAHMENMKFSKIPAEFRSMKRLWPNVAGLRARRDHEADLFQRGLTQPIIKPVPQPVPAPVPKPVPVPSPPPSSKGSVAGGVVVAGGAAAGTAAARGHGVGTIAVIVLITLAAAIGAYLYLHGRSKK